MRNGAESIPAAVGETKVALVTGGVERHRPDEDRDRSGFHLDDRPYQEGDPMKRSLFLLITAILALLFGALMFLAPSLAAQFFGIPDSVGIDGLFRIIGSTLLGLAVLNFLARNQPSSPTLAAVLWADVATHTIGFIADLWSAGAGAFTFTAALPGFVVHAFVAVGALIYVLRMD